MGVNPVLDPNNAEGIRCSECVHVCPKHALTFAASPQKEGERLMEHAETTMD